MKKIIFVISLVAIFVLTGVAIHKKYDPLIVIIILLFPFPIFVSQSINAYVSAVKREKIGELIKAALFADIVSVLPGIILLLVFGNSIPSAIGACVLSGTFIWLFDVAYFNKEISEDK